MISTLLVVLAFGQVAANNVRPQIGYVYPPGGRAGTTVEVRLGTYDWTPDMQLFVHDPRLKLEVTGPAGEPILTPPPYWFGTKAGLAQPPLPREVPAKITIPADMPPGPVRWQAANANGGTNTGTFIVSHNGEVVEPDKYTAPIELPSLPVVVSGRIAKITEIDTYRFKTSSAGLLTCRLDDRLGQPFNGVVTVRDQNGALVSDVADTIGRGAQGMFVAEANAWYEVSIQDVDFGGDRGYVYRLTIEQGPRCVTTVPRVVARGQSTSVEVLGWGVATGAKKLESVTQAIVVPASATGAEYTHAFDTPFGRTSVTVLLDDNTDTRESASEELAQRRLTLPTALTGTLDRLDAKSQMPLDRYTFEAKKGDLLRITAEAAQLGTPVDPSIAIVSTEGKELIRNDDLLNTIDAAVDFTAPEDGVYELIVSDLSGSEPTKAHVYRLLVEDPDTVFDFSIVPPEKFDLQLGGKGDMVVGSKRRGAWDEPIELTLEHLPAGVKVPPPPAPAAAPMPPVKGVKPKPAPKAKGARKPAPGDLKVPLESADNEAASATLAMVVATATVEDRTLVRRAGPVLVTTTLKTRCKVKSAVQDGGRLVNRGTTYPADVLIERLEDYQGPVQLRMASAQQRQRRGIRGPDLLVPAGVEQVQYPVFMPEWLETSLTARINVIGVTQVPDPKGNIRHVTGVMDGLIVMSLEGALLKLSHEPKERVVKLGSTIEIPLKVSRTVKLPAKARVELIADPELPTLATADPLTVAEDQSAVNMTFRIGSDKSLVGRRSVTLRATVMQHGQWPVVSETVVPLFIESADGSVAAK